MNLTPDYVAWAGIGAIASAVVSVLATVAAFRAAGSAQRSTEMAAAEKRKGLVRETYRNAHRAAVTAKRVEQIADVVRKAYTNMYIAAGQHGSSGMAAIGASLDELHQRTKQISDYSLTFVESEPKHHSDEFLATTQRRVDEHLVQLEAMKERLLQELDLARTGASSPHAAVHQAAALRDLYGLHGSGE
jgi:hypothetical protein